VADDAELAGTTKRRPYFAWAASTTRTRRTGRHLFPTIPDPYDGEGRVHLRLEGRLRNTVIVVAGDHGEAFEHGERGHGLLLYQETVRVPLVVVHPALALPA
jgi:hypothetical protein